MSSRARFQPMGEQCFHSPILDSQDRPMAFWDKNSQDYMSQGKKNVYANAARHVCEGKALFTSLSTFYVIIFSSIYNHHHHHHQRISS